jgi:hypothetical protein
MSWPGGLVEAGPILRRVQLESADGGIGEFLFTAAAERLGRGFVPVMFVPRSEQGLHLTEAKLVTADHGIGRAREHHGQRQEVGRRDVGEVVNVGQPPLDEVRWDAQVRRCLLALRGTEKAPRVMEALVEGGIADAASLSASGVCLDAVAALADPPADIVFQSVGPAVLDTG